MLPGQPPGVQPGASAAGAEGALQLGLGVCRLVQGRPGFWSLPPRSRLAPQQSGLQALRIRAALLLRQHVVPQQAAVHTADAQRVPAPQPDRRDAAVSSARSQQTCVRRYAACVCHSNLLLLHHSNAAAGTHLREDFIWRFLDSGWCPLSTYTSASRHWRCAVQAGWLTGASGAARLHRSSHPRCCGPLT